MSQEIIAVLAGWEQTPLTFFPEPSKYLMLSPQREHRLCHACVDSIVEGKGEVKMYRVTVVHPHQVNWKTLNYLYIEQKTVIDNGKNYDR